MKMSGIQQGNFFYVVGELNGTVDFNPGAGVFNLTSKLNAGVVWANTFNKFDPASPFGGYKESGFGREGGVHGLDQYLKFV